jgi:K+ potassium transporter
MALMAVLGGEKKKRAVIVAVGLFGAALIYGDGAITPAISVLPALEGLSILTSKFDPYVVPMTWRFSSYCSSCSPGGRRKSAGCLATIGVLGIWGIAQNPSVFNALSPLAGLSYLFSGGLASFLVLGAVFLCVTGAEALYADMGHFGRLPIHHGGYCDCSKPYGEGAQTPAEGEIAAQTRASGGRAGTDIGEVARFEFAGEGWVVEEGACARQALAAVGQIIGAPGRRRPDREAWHPALHNAMRILQGLSAFWRQAAGPGRGKPRAGEAL